MTIEQQLQSDITEVKNTLNALKNALIGSEFGPGRIPKIEDDVRDIDKRVKALEKFYWKTAGAYAALITLFELAMHFVKH